MHVRDLPQAFVWGPPLHHNTLASCPWLHMTHTLCDAVGSAQAHEYESTQGLPLNEFFDSTAGRFKTGAG